MVRLVEHLLHTHEDVSLDRCAEAGCGDVRRIPVPGRQRQQEPWGSLASCAASLVSCSFSEKPHLTQHHLWPPHICSLVNMYLHMYEIWMRERDRKNKNYSG